VVRVKEQSPVFNYEFTDNWPRATDLRFPGLESLFELHSARSFEQYDVAIARLRKRSRTPRAVDHRLRQSAHTDQNLYLLLGEMLAGGTVQLLA
jgi:hypothetical protein